MIESGFFPSNKVGNERRILIHLWRFRSLAREVWLRQGWQSWLASISEGATTPGKYFTSKIISFLEHNMTDTNPAGVWIRLQAPKFWLIAPATEPQVEIWTSCLIGGSAANCAYNECFSLLLTGIFNKMHAACPPGNGEHAWSITSSFSADGTNICGLQGN